MDAQKFCQAFSNFLNEKGYTLRYPIGKLITKVIDAQYIHPSWYKNQIWKYTTRDVFDHLIGFADIDEQQFFTRQELIKHVFANPPQKKVGEFHYSNAAYEVMMGFVDAIFNLSYN